MSIGATNWAYRQKIPIKPKFVLQALADQTDERTGRVCYGKTDMKYLAEKCSVPERSLYRYIGALMRNGYVIRESGKEKGQPSVYWLCLDRPRSASLSEWKAVGALDDDDLQDVEEGSANLAEGLEPENDSETNQNGRGGPPQGGRPRVSDSPRDISNARTCARDDVGFSRKAQDLERDSIQIEKAAQRAGARYFVIEGSRAWKAWCDYRRAHGQVGTLPTCSGQGEHSGKRGWPMPSLFPPSESASTGPPQGALRTRHSRFQIKRFGECDADDFGD